MRLSRSTDYGLRILMYLSANRDELCTIARIAARYDVSRGHLMKVANDLVRAGFVNGIRGRTGGLRLARQAERIRLGDVVRAMETDFALVECQQAPGRCLIEPCCRLESILAKATEAFVDALDRYTVADLVSGNSALSTLLTETA